MAKTVSGITMDVFVKRLTTVVNSEMYTITATSIGRASAPMPSSSVGRFAVVTTARNSGISTGDDGDLERGIGEGGERRYPR